MDGRLVLVVSHGFSLVESAVAVLAFGFGGHKLGHIFLIAYPALQLFKQLALGVVENAVERCFNHPCDFNGIAGLNEDFRITAFGGMQAAEQVFDVRRWNKPAFTLGLLQRARVLAEKKAGIAVGQNGGAVLTIQCNVLVNLPNMDMQLLRLICMVIKKLQTMPKSLMNG